MTLSTAALAGKSIVVQIRYALKVHGSELGGDTSTPIHKSVQFIVINFSNELTTICR